MRAIHLAAALLLGLSISGSAAPKITIPRTPQQALPGELQAFFGQVKEVNLAARTITLGMPMRFTFKVPAGSEITIRRGGTATLGAIKPFPEEMSALTREGKTITGLGVAEYITYQPRADFVGRNFPHGDGQFLLTLRPDGTIASVRLLKPLPAKQLDAIATARLMQMKFRPGALTEVRMPVTFLLHHLR